MLKYSDITQRFIEFRREQDEYWEHLRKAAYQLLKDLQVSLELPSESWTDEEASFSTTLISAQQKVVSLNACIRWSAKAKICVTIFRFELP